MKQTSILRSIGLFIVTLWLVGSPLNAEAQEVGIVISASAPLLAFPEPGAAMLSEQPRGTEFSVTASSDGFVGVELASGEEGWLPEAKVGFKVEDDGKVCLEVGFEQAIGEGLMTASFHGGGDFSGTSVIGDLHLAAELGITVCPVIRQAFAITPGIGQDSEHRYQRMLVRSVRARQTTASRDPTLALDSQLEGSFSPEGEIQLGGAESASGTYAFEAYCLDAERLTPPPGLEMAADFQMRVPKINIQQKVDEELFLLAVWISRHDFTTSKSPGLLCLYLRGLNTAERNTLRTALENEADLDRLVEFCEEPNHREFN